MLLSPIDAFIDVEAGCCIDELLSIGIAEIDYLGVLPNERIARDNVRDAQLLKLSSCDLKEVASPRTMERNNGG